MGIFDKKLFNFDFFINIHLIFDPELLIPDYHITDLLDLQNILPDSRVEGIVFDLDQTIVPFREDRVDPSIQAFLKSLRNTYPCCILSNFPHLESKIQRIRKIEAQTGISAVFSERKKPSPFAFHDALRYLGTPPERTAMIGDRIFTDIIGANSLHLITVWVDPIDRKKDPLLTVRGPRSLEERYLKFIQRLRA